ncbi:unnamed protein product [Adineta steineri]|uniref:CH-like domain-containing protein n=1 Tax=Adineta steineri TaxID=433720 RepID=A0A815M2E7_9BILA|nr:unnamed protein product [Adineta steineri]CAF3842567.1 unnamed protein product [Adineta steineri]
MVARTPREILRWLESLYLTYPVAVPRWDLANGFTYGEILHAYFGKDINMFCFINGRSLNARLLNWALIKQFLVKKNLSVPIHIMDATLHAKDGAAEELLEHTYQLLTNKKAFIDPPYERDDDFSDHPYQQSLDYFEQASAAKALKNNIKVTELMTDPSYAYHAKKSQAILDQARADRQAIRAANPKRFCAKRTLAEKCLRQPLRAELNPQEWYTKSFDSRSRSAASLSNKSSIKHHSRHGSVDVSKKDYPQQYNDQGFIEANENNAIYREIILRQHAVPLGDLLQTFEA